MIGIDGRLIKSERSIFGKIDNYSGLLIIIICIQNDFFFFDQLFVTGMDNGFEVNKSITLEIIIGYCDCVD